MREEERKKLAEEFEEVVEKKRVFYPPALMESSPPFERVRETKIQAGLSEFDALLDDLIESSVAPVPRELEYEDIFQVPLTSLLRTDKVMISTFTTVLLVCCSICLASVKVVY